jgi:hypothetical protein
MKEQERTNLVLGNSDGFRETEEGKSEVDESVLVLFDVGLTIDDLFAANFPH